MAKELSPTAKSILVLLNNIDELIVLSNNRKDAREVMRALTIYAQGKSFSIPSGKVENFYAILLDGRPETISFIVKDIAGDVIKNGMK
jgi:hypothetical protein